MGNGKLLGVDRSAIRARFFEPVPGVSPLHADVASVHSMPTGEYWIQQRVVGFGGWRMKCRYGQDIDWAVERVRWWNRLLRGRQRFRVVFLLGDSLSVVFGEGSGNV